MWNSMDKDIPLKPAIVGLAIGLAMLLVGEMFTSNDYEYVLRQQWAGDRPCPPEAYLEDKQNHNPDKDVK